MSSKLSWNTRKTEDKRTRERERDREAGWERLDRALLVQCHRNGSLSSSGPFISVVVFLSDFCRITKTNFLLDFSPFFCYSSLWHKNAHGICRYVQRERENTNCCIHKMREICCCALSLLSQCHLFRESISVVNSPNETHISIENKLLVIAWDPFGKQKTSKYSPYGLLCMHCHLYTVLRRQWNHRQYHSNWFCCASPFNYQPFVKQTS